MEETDVSVSLSEVSVSLEETRRLIRSRIRGKKRHATLYLKLACIFEGRQDKRSSALLHAESTTCKRVGRPESIPPLSSADLEHSIQTAPVKPNKSEATVNHSNSGGDHARIDSCLCQHRQALHRDDRAQCAEMHGPRHPRRPPFGRNRVLQPLRPESPQLPRTMEHGERLHDCAVLQDRGGPERVGRPRAFGDVCPLTQGPHNKRRAGKQTGAHASGGRRDGRRRAGARDAHGARSGHACWQPRVVKYHDFDRVPRVGVLRHKRYRNELVDFDQHILLLILIAPNLLSMPPPLSLGVCALLPVPREHMSKTLSE